MNSNCLVSRRRLKVLFVVPSLQRGGAETQVIDLVNGLPSSTYEKYLFCFEGGLDQLDKVNKHDVHFLHEKRKTKLGVNVYRAIAKVIDEERIDIVHCTLQIALWYAWIGKLLAKRKPHIVLALHTTIHRCKKDEFFEKFVFRWAMKNAVSVICVCRTQELYRVSKAPYIKGKTVVIHNGVDASFFDRDQAISEGIRLRQQLGIEDNAKVICNIAGFRPEKGHAILIEAFSRLLEGDQDVYLLLAGEGKLRPMIEHLVTQHGLTDRVFLLGNLADVRPVLAASDVATIASTAVETFSIAMLEAMAMGVPMVATDVGGTSEAVIDERTGYLVPSNDAKAFTEALHRIIDDDINLKRMSREARQLVLQNFDKQGMLDKTKELLERKCFATT